MKKWLLVRCQYDDCQAIYRVRSSQSPLIQRGFIDMGFCPVCQRARNPLLYVAAMHDWRCEACGLPEPYVEKKSHLFCNNCRSKFVYEKRVKSKVNMIQLCHDDQREQTGK